MRYGFPVALSAAAVIVLVAVVYRLSVSSEVERDEEDEARAYLCAHGQWADETPQEPQSRCTGTEFVVLRNGLRVETAGIEPASAVA